MITTETCLHLHGEAQGTTYRGILICGIGPTGFFLNTSSKHVIREYEGQRQSLVRFGHIARNTDNCIVLIVYDEPKTGMDLHDEAAHLLRHEAQLPADHAIHLVAYRASAVQLQHWLDTLSNVVFGVQQAQLTSLCQALRLGDRTSERYLHALDLQTFFKYVPLKHIAVHSCCPSPFPNGLPGYSKHPLS